MKQVGILEASTNLSHLIDEAGRGEEIIITRQGHPVARLVRAGVELPAEQLSQRQAAVSRLMEIARELNTRASHQEIKGWINEGRH